MRFTAALGALCASLFATANGQQYAGDTINVTLPGVPGSEIAFFKIKDPQGLTNKTITLVNYYSHGKNINQRLNPLNVQRAVIVIHGQNRDPGTYMSNMLSALAQVNNDPNISFDNVAILAPYFANGADKGVVYPFNSSLTGGRGSTSSILAWFGSEWSGGGTNQYPYYAKRISSFEVLDQLVQYFDNTTIFPNMKQIVVAGHSLGAQTTQRYASVGKDLGTNSPVTYWIGNPNSYGWPSISRPLSTFTCPTYDNWREGYADYSTYGYYQPIVYGQALVASGRDNIVANFQSKQVAWARGTLDLGDDSSDCDPEPQGGDRNERFFNWIKQFPPSCPDPAGRHCDTVDFAPIGHDAGSMFASPGGRARLFTDNFYGNGSRSYDFGYPRQQAGDDPFPNPALVNTPIPRPNGTYAGGYTYIGCYSDQTPASLTNTTYSSGSNTIEMCTAACYSGGNSIAAMTGNACFCGNSLGFQAREVIDSSCYVTCPGNSNEICGGSNRLSLYSNNGVPSVQPTPQTPTTIGNYTYQGCFNESATGHALTALSYSNQNNNTLENCAAFCSNYKYFGTEYGAECYCGNTFLSENATTASDCDMLCTGNNAEWCGAGSRLTLYMNPNYVVPASLSVSCPGSNNQTYTSNGKNFTIECGFDHQGGDLTSASATSLGGCLDLCAQNAQCVDAVWNGNTCYMKSTLGPYVANSALAGGRLSNVTVGGGAPTNTGSPTSTVAAPTGSTTANTLSCPANNNQTYVASNNETFVIECGFDHQGGDLTSLTVNGLQACIEACATTSGCVDAVLSGSACYLKSSLGPYLTNSGLSGARLSNVTVGGGAPTSTAATGTTAPTSTATGISCPGSNNQTYVAPNNQTFVIECGYDHQGGDLSSLTVSSLSGCLNACATTTGCVDAVLSGSACYLKSSLGPYLPNANLAGGRLSSVTLSSSPTASPTTATSTGSSGSTATPTSNAPSCPGSNGQNYIAANNETFVIECGIDHQGGDLTSVGGVTFQQCIETCAANSQCVDVSLSGSACYLKSSVGPAVNNGVFGARLIAGGAAPTSVTTSSAAVVTAASTGSSSSSSSSSSSTSTTTTASSVPLPSNFAPLGCFIDNGAGGRVLPISNGSSSTNTPAQCALNCRAQGYQFSGTEYSSQCFCGNYLPNTNTSSSQCNMACSGDATQPCGAGNRLNIVQDLTYKQSFFARQSFSTWNLMACYVDSTTRTLPNGVNLNAFGGPNNATIPNCMSACQAAGYTYCGAEYYTQCFGSNSAPNATLIAPGSSDPLQAGCNYPCSGNTTESCGGSNRILVYVNNGTAAAAGGSSATLNSNTTAASN